MSDAATAEDAFGVETGDTVLVRVREDGQLVAKFVAEVDDLVEPLYPGRPPRAKLRLPWGKLEQSTVRPTEADLEAVEDRSEVSF